MRIRHAISFVSLSGVVALAAAVQLRTPSPLDAQAGDCWQCQNYQCDSNNSVGAMDCEEFSVDGNNTCGLFKGACGFDAISLGGQVVPDSDGHTPDADANRRECDSAVIARAAY